MLVKPLERELEAVLQFPIPAASLQGRHGSETRYCALGGYKPAWVCRAACSRAAGECGRSVSRAFQSAAVEVGVVEEIEEVHRELDPIALFAPWPALQKRAQIILDQAGGRAGHIFNLGHGILPNTPIDNVKRLVDFVHEYQVV